MIVGMNYTLSITSKGQVTIPKPIRKKLGLKEGGTATFTIKPSGEVVLERPQTLAEVRLLLRQPSHKDPLSEKEQLIASQLATKYDAR